MRVGLIGDSQGQGLSTFLRQAFTARGDSFSSMTVPGMSIRSMRNSSELTHEAQNVARDADVLIVAMGGNDRPTSIDVYERELGWFLQAVASRPRRIWWIGTAHSEEGWVADWHQRVRTYQRQLLARAPRVTWIDAWPMTMQGHAPDGVHFTRAGYERWAGLIMDRIGSSLRFLGAALLGVAVGLWAAIRRR